MRLAIIFLVSLAQNGFVTREQRRTLKIEVADRAIDQAFKHALGQLADH